MSRIAIATPNLNTYSETFIHAHIDRLPSEIHVLSGGICPTLADGEPLIKYSNSLQRVRFRLIRQVQRLPWNGEAKRLAALEQFFQKNQIQAVLAEYGPTGVAMMEVCEKTRTPLVVHFHGYDAYLTNVLAQYKREYSALFEMAAALIVVSRDMYEQLLNLGAPKKKMYLNPYGVDLTQFAGATPSEMLPKFLAVGRFVDKKGPLLTLLAFNKTLKSVPDARLVMIGDGPLLNASKQLVRAMNFEYAVDFRGAQPHNIIVLAMQQARAFVQHSLRADDGDSEGTPVAILEAGATGLPVISTRHAGIPDVVVNGETGILVDEGDLDSMVDAMTLLAQDSHLAARMGQAGRKRIEDYFSIKMSIDNLWKIIDAVIKESSNIDALR